MAAKRRARRARRIIAHAKRTLALIRKSGGAAPPGYQGNRVFHNRERRLPPGNYHSYDVYRSGKQQRRRAERIVIEQNTGRAYFTLDHYRSFKRLDGQTKW